MSSILSIYTASPLQFALELLWVTQAVKIDPEFADITIVNIDGQRAKLRTVAKPNAADGRVPKYKGINEFVYRKISLPSIFPRDLVYGDSRPIRFDQLRAYMLASYDYRLEEGEFSQVGDPQQRPLVSGMTLTVAPDAGGFIYLRTTPQASRWVAGENIRIRLTDNQN